MSDTPDVDRPRLLSIRARHDVDRASREVRALGRRAGLAPTEVEELGLAVAELAANLVRYAVDGTIALSTVRDDHRTGVLVTSRDAGPGIANLALAMQDGHSTGGGLGSGLPAARRLMSEFDIESSPAGTIVTARKWPA